jgi:serine protease SohB
MSEFFLQYGLFLAETITIVVAIGIIIILAVSAGHKGKQDGQLKVTDLKQRYKDMTQTICDQVMDKKELKAEHKAEKEKAKQVKKQEKKDKKANKHQDDTPAPQRIFVIDFHGDIKASGVAALREEITALLSLEPKPSEIVVRLDNAGGMVHEHGLASSQMERIRKAGIPLTVAVDKVAASGGYMMACVADKILAAPFAVIGSIGVIAQLPNFNRLLDRHGIDFEQFKAGEYKRTVTLFGKNSDEDREKFSEELEETHVLFKDFVVSQRPQLDIDQVAKGEHWYGSQALTLKLVDEITTSDDYLMEAAREGELYGIEYEAHKTLSEKLSGIMQKAADGLLLSWWDRASRPALLKR